jgi:hypothetical protein
MIIRKIISTIGSMTILARDRNGMGRVEKKFFGGEGRRDGARRRVKNAPCFVL